MSAVRSRAVTLTTGLAILALTGPLLVACNGDPVFYRPPEASISDHADCLAPDIDRQLSALSDDDIVAGPSAAGMGYPPRGFTPVAVVRCERGESPSGAQTIDSVRLEGDVEAAWDAFRAESERFPDNVEASCAVLEIPPAGVWFVDDVGRAVRPAWPAVPCGLQERPLAALSNLHEVERQQHPKELPADNPGVCTTKYGSAFSTTTDADATVDPQRDTRERIAATFAVAFPIDDVRRLQVCRYSEAGETPVEQSRSRLTLAQSVDVVRGIVVAAPALACSLVATRTAVIPLRRPDGSGGARIDVELDGCRRAAAVGIGYVALPDAVVDILDEAPG